MQIRAVVLDQYVRLQNLALQERTRVPEEDDVAVAEQDIVTQAKQTMDDLDLVRARPRSS